MKNNILSLFTLLSLGALLVLVPACQEDIPVQAEYTDYAFASTDEGGGTWTPVLLEAPDQVAIPEPADIQSAEYLAELEEVKALSSGISGAQQSVVDYWTNNPILRWNEIALALVAKYNLIPGPNPDGTYTLPSPGNPAGPPPFPFAHPPYAVRALAYLSVAQFDGLIAAWHYQQLYQRPAPAQVDGSVQTAYVDNGLPSYPADAAVIAAASRDILSAMFPLEKDYLAQQAEEHMASLLWAGAHVASDIEAGALIGTEVAKIGLARAAGDGMSKAQCPKPVADSISDAAFQRFGWRWVNIELPARPVGLCPLFGQVTTWSIPNVEDVRSPVPPAPGSPEYLEAVEELEYFRDNMTTEWRAIANFWQDGLTTYTPPGHWNRFAKDWAIRYQLNPLRTARMFAYLNMAMMDGGIACWDTKFYYNYPRPINLIEGFRTIAGTPNFPAYTSGHSVFSSAGAEVLSYLFPQDAPTFRAWAKEAADSRVYGGIHWRFDAVVGTEQGVDVAEYTLARARTDGAD